MSDYQLNSTWAEVDLAAATIKNGVQKSNLSSGVQASLNKADSAYQKPGGGIPGTDLASAVQTSLAKAETAYQKPGGGIPASDLATDAKVFWVTISGTGPYTCDCTLAEIRAARAAGAVVRAKLPGGFESDFTCDDDGVIFYAFDDSGGPLLLLRYAVGAAGVAFSSINLSSGGGLSDEAKIAILTCFRHVEWADESGPDCYAALEAALGAFVSIAADFDQGSAKIYNDADLDDLRQYLTVTGTRPNGTTATVEDYELTGTLTAGTSTITVIVGTLTATFTVEVTQRMVPVEYEQCDYITTAGASYFQILTPIPAGYAVRTVAMQAAYDSQYRVPCGGGNEAVYIGYMNFTATDKKVGAFYGTRANAYVSMPSLYGLKTECVAEIASTYVKATVRNTTGTYTLTTESSNLQASNMFRVGYNGVTAAAFIGRIYEIEVRDGSNNPFIHYIPCVRIADNVAGMYDVVNNVFKVSDTATAFGWGNEAA